MVDALFEPHHDHANRPDRVKRSEHSEV